jgi:hypothetical protein
VSCVHGSPSSICSGVPGVQTPVWHVSVPLQTLLSPQPGAGPSGTGVLMQAPLGHVSTVQGFPSLQSVACVAGVQFFTTQFPVAGSQTLPGGQTTSVPWWQPIVGEHVSTPLQAFPSSAQVTGVCWQPLEWSHVSIVHGFPSSQLRSWPLQTPSWHVSPTVQALPSSHPLPFGSGSLRQPNVLSQRSAVQALPSEQPVGTIFRQRTSQPLAQPGGSQSSHGEVTTLSPQIGHGTRQSIGWLGAVHGGFATFVNPGVTVPLVCGRDPSLR